MTNLKKLFFQISHQWNAGFFRLVISGTRDIRGDQGQNRRTDQPGRKRHPGGEKQAISLRNSRPAGEIVIQPAK